MRRSLLRNAFFCIPRNLLLPHHHSSSAASLAVLTHSRFRLFSFHDKPYHPLPSTNEKPSPVPSTKDSVFLDIQDVDNKEFKSRIDKYLKGDETMLPSIMEAIMLRKLSGKHEDTDDELKDELKREPISDVADEDFESDFEDMHDTDEEIDDLYNVRDIVMKRMVKDDIVEDGFMHGS